MSNALIDFIDKLSATGSAASLYGVSRDYLVGLGFRYMNVAMFHTETQENFGMFSNMSEDWMNHYVASGYGATDPYVEFGVGLEGSAVVPHRHFMSNYEDRPKPLQSLLKEVEAEGFKSSYMHSKTSKGSKIKVGLNLVLDQDMEDMHHLIGARHGEIVVGSALAQLSFMDFVSKDLVGPDYFKLKEHSNRLTPRETEIVKWLAAGLRNDRIADRLTISSATVNFHIVSAKRKLDAKTREQLVAIAILRGWIEP